MLENLSYLVNLLYKDENNQIVVLVKEKDLADFMKNLDTKIYEILSIYGIGDLITDYNELLSKPTDLETGNKEE